MRQALQQQGTILHAVNYALLLLPDFSLILVGYNGPYVAGLVTLSTVLGLASFPLALGLLR